MSMLSARFLHKNRGQVSRQLSELKFAHQFSWLGDLWRLSAVGRAHKTLGEGWPFDTMAGLFYDSGISDYWSNRSRGIILKESILDRQA
ncbi:hypothetical protein CEXT_301791 [Caerostris extrusa]|uniref:Uncharacterized protein n=1 Tax=Caerostris extrusa TaxID=172846 RepID=A0AAV4X7W4_CAEEX|nr:hypothetical protein CEXT_301791 [Caerostris extrusa]